MSKRNLRFDPNRQYALDESPHGPLVKAILVVLGLLVAAALFVFVILPAMQEKPAFPAETPAPSVEAASPAPSGTPSLPAVAISEKKTLLLEGDFTGMPVLDARILDGCIYFVTGPDPLRPDTLVQYDPAAQTAARIDRPVSEEGAVRRFIGNDQYYVYLVMNAARGGSIRVIDRRTGTDEWLCDFIDGAPELMLHEHVLCYRARTIEHAAKLFAVDLETRASAVAAVFTDSATVSSRVTLLDGRLLFAEAIGETKSVIVSLDISSGARREWTVSGPAFDPAAIKAGPVYLSAPGGPDARLYLLSNAGGPRCIAEHVIQYSVSGDCVIYSSDEGIFAYAAATDAHYPLTTGSSRLLSAENGYVLFQEDLDTEQSAIRYLETE